MKNFPPFSENMITSLAEELGELLTGSQINSALKACWLWDNSGESTKWKRLDWVFRDSQHHNGHADEILHFLQHVLDPVRHVKAKDRFEKCRREVNTILAFCGLAIGADGKITRIEVVRTLDEAERRAKTIQDKIRDRNIHDEVTKCCTAELMQENYFHAVFEATKGLAQRVRELSGVDGDGSSLVDIVFSLKKCPKLAFNSLQTETEKSEHRGFAALLKGCFQAVRNPLAHEPKIHWEGEDNAADYLSLISLLHRKLDDCEVYVCEEEGSL